MTPARSMRSLLAPLGASLVAAALILPMAAAPALAGDAPQREISVQGEAQVQARPDMALITLGVTQDAPAAQEAMAQTAQAVARILARLEGLGLEPRDVQTSDLSLNPVWHHDQQKGSAEIVGFSARNTLNLRVRNLDALPGILDAVLTDGANLFNGLQFTVANSEELETAARAAAVADAIARAQTLAQAAGVTLGPVLSIQEQGGGRPMPMRAEMLAKADAMPIAEGEVAIGASVAVTFAIAD